MSRSSAARRAEPDAFGAGILELRVANRSYSVENARVVRPPVVSKGTKISLAEAIYAGSSERERNAWGDEIVLVLEGESTLAGLADPLPTDHSVEPPAS